VAVSGRTVAWVDGSALHLGDLAGGRDRMVRPPPGADGFAAPGAFSPDGRTLAAVTSVGFSTRPALALVAVDRASAVRVTGSDGALSDRCSPCLAWAPAGDWVFFSRLGPGFGIGAYRLGRPRAVIVPVEVPFSFPPSFAATRTE
jgi:Tol biopolymer transport system component